MMAYRYLFFTHFHILLYIIDTVALHYIPYTPTSIAVHYEVVGVLC